jgi:hypothetical protein
LQEAEILHPILNRALNGAGDMADVADAVIPKAENFQTRGLGTFIQHFAHFTIQHLPGVGQIFEQEWQTEQTDFRHDLTHCALAVCRHLNDPG